MQILIRGNSNNPFASTCAWALHNRGHQIYTDFQHNFPYGACSSFHIGNNAISLHLPELPLDSSIYDVVISLDSRQVVTDPYLASDEVSFVMAEADIYLRSTDYFFRPDCFQINPVCSYAASGLKPVQLKAAVSAGFNIPETLISNDPEAIREFITKFENVVYKPFENCTWTDQEGQYYCTPANRIDLDVLAQNTELMVLSPLIFQQCIPKIAEIRAVVFGNTVLAVSLPVVDPELVDWRSDAPKILPMMKRHQLPATVVTKILALCKSFTLHFAALDLLLTADGNYVFLEVNNIGRFLWMEHRDNGHPMLDIFCQFVESKDVDFLWDGNAEYLLEQYKTGV